MSTLIPLTDQHIADIIRDLRHDVHFVKKLWSDCIPVGEWNIETEIGFIVSSLPVAAECSPHFVAMQLTIGQDFVDNWAKGVNPAVVHAWAEAYPDTLKEVALAYSGRRWVPDHIKSNAEWCCLCALREALSMIADIGGDTVCMASDVETVQSAFVGWLHEVQEG